MFNSCSSVLRILLHAHITAPPTASAIQYTKILPIISMFPGSCPGFPVHFLFVHSLFRIADTACVCSDLSGLEYCYAGDVTHILSPSLSSLPLSKDTLISTYPIDRISFLLIYFFEYVFPLSTAWISQYLILYVRLKKLSYIYNPGCFFSFYLSKRCSDCFMLVDCLYICWIFVVDCVFWSGRQKAYGCYPFQKVVRHIFIHVNIIFYIWIVGLFNELQYNAMYFYIVSSFLFKDRDYFISC